MKWKWLCLGFSIPRKAIMEEIKLTAEKEAEMERILDVVKGAAEVQIRELARLLASKPNAELLGATEYLVRDGVHRIGARLLEAALEERKKGGLAGRA